MDGLVQSSQRRPARFKSRRRVSNSALDRLKEANAASRFLINLNPNAEPRKLSGSSPAIQGRRKRHAQLNAPPPLSPVASTWPQGRTVYVSHSLKCAATQVRVLDMIGV